MSHYTITIARGFGSGGRTIGMKLAERLGIGFYDRDLIKLASEESGINLSLFGQADERKKAALFSRYDRAYGERLISPESGNFTSDDNLFNYQAKIIKKLSAEENCIIVGRCADYVLKDQPHVLRLFFYASREFCVKQVSELYALSPRDAERQIERIDRARSTYYRYYTGGEWDNARNYDLSINTELLGFDGCVDALLQYIKAVFPDA